MSISLHRLHPAAAAASRRLLLFSDLRLLQWRPHSGIRKSTFAAFHSPLQTAFHACLRDYTFEYARSGRSGGRRGSWERCKAFKSTTPDTPRASLTWGILPRSPEGRAEVLEYLKREGIDTTELQDVELPSSLEVARERIDFLKRIGLRMEAINNYPLMISCSVKKNLIPVLDYLVELGITEKALPSFLEKYPMVLHSSVVVDLMPVIDYLQGLDIRKKHIPFVLLRFPDVLGFKLEGTISTSIAYLVGIGVDRKSIGRMLTEHPEILGMRVANMIKPKVDFLISLGIPKNIVARLLEMQPELLGYSLAGTMRPAVDDLRKAGVKDEELVGMITHYPEILGQNLSKNLREKTQWLVEQVRIASCDVPIIFEQLPQVLFVKKTLAIGRIAFLRKAGFSARDVSKMVLACPQLLAISIAQALRPSIDFLVRVMKRPIIEVVEFPAYFTYDLITRIQLRHKLLAKRGIKCSLEWFLNCSDQRFQERLEAGHVDDNHLGLVFQMGGPISLRVDEDKNMNPFDWEIQATPQGQGHTKLSEFKSGNSHREGFSSKDGNEFDGQVRYWPKKDKEALPVESERVRRVDHSKAENQRCDNEDVLTSESDDEGWLYSEHQYEAMLQIHGRRKVEECNAESLQYKGLDNEDEEEDESDNADALQIRPEGVEKEEDLDMSESASEFDESENDNSLSESEDGFNEPESEEEYDDPEELAELSRTAVNRRRRP